MADAVGLALEAVILRLSLRDLANDALYADKVRWLLSRLPRGTRCAPIDLPPSFWRVPIPHVNAFRQTWHMPVARAATTRFFCGAVGGHPVRTRKRRAVGHQPAVADRGGAARRPAAGTEAGGSGGDGPAESPVFVRNVRGDADACDGLLRGRRSENALLTMIEVSVAEMLCPCSMMWLFKGAMSASPAACAATS